LQLTIVIPTYNEAENLPKLIEALFSLPLEGLKILVVDDDSPDGTGQTAKNLSKDYANKLSVIGRAGKLGLGTAYITGFKRALEQGAEAVGQMDADFSHPPGKVEELMRVLETCDLALGSRYVPGGSLDEDWPVWRKNLSNFGNFYARTILRLPVRDTTGGFRIWRRKTLLGMPLARVRSNGYAFQIEMLYLAHRLGYTYREVPFYFSEREEGNSKMSFNIQLEAVHRVWELLFEYRDIKPIR
jgi:dolichol-phosphate mannosyltransferase